MPKLRVHNLAISLDGYAAGPSQSPDNPLGLRGLGLHEWAFATRTARRMQGLDGGEAGPDDDFVAQGDRGIGATIMGRNMFGPIRGAWGSAQWTGWWGDDPPFHHPVFVLTHHHRPSITMQGGTTSTSSTTGSRRRSSERSRPPTELTSGSAVVLPPSSNTSARG
jgi:dihydrofolate reductase